LQDSKLNGSDGSERSNANPIDPAVLKPQVEAHLKVLEDASNNNIVKNSTNEWEEIASIKVSKKQDSDPLVEGRIISTSTKVHTSNTITQDEGKITFTPTKLPEDIPGLWNVSSDPIDSLAYLQ
jgi:hypothetical protein